MNGASRSPITRSIRSRFGLLIQMLGVAGGLALTGFLITHVHIVALEHALSEIGYGIVFLVLLHLVSILLDSQAWYIALRRLRARLGRDLVAGAACLRNAVQTLVPLGASGFISGYRTLRHHQVSPHTALSSLIFETTITTAGELFLLLASAVMVFRGASPTERSTFLNYAPLAMFLAVVLAVALVLQLRGKVFDTLGRGLEKLGPGTRRSSWSRFPRRVKHGLWRLYRSPAVWGWGFLWQLASLFVGAGAVWLAFSLIHAQVPFMDAVFFLCLARALRSFGFLIPSAWGLQEGLFILLAPLAAVSPTAGLTVSLILRVRDFFFAFATVAVGRFARRGHSEKISPPPLPEGVRGSLVDE
ncbi:MAG: lysylphosphatidylglycerol synthase domain-containing protein [Gammaproteobacteria bacterium]|nr:lysylphosphatidylglycerol synthase domain-containing protein [Gammaproteobacteria bacterium]